MAWRSVSRGSVGQAIELRNHLSGVPTLLDDGEGNPAFSGTREPGDPVNWP
jgi:hypothetical protein